MKKVYTREVAKDIVESFEDLLEKNNISIPDEYREGDEFEARIYGTTYDELLSEVEFMIVELLERTGIDYKIDSWNGGNWIEM